MTDSKHNPTTQHANPGGHEDKKSHQAPGKQGHQDDQQGSKQGGAKLPGAPKQDQQGGKDKDRQGQR